MAQFIKSLLLISFFLRFSGKKHFFLINEPTCYFMGTRRFGREGSQKTV